MVDDHEGKEGATRLQLLRAPARDGPSLGLASQVFDIGRARSLDSVPRSSLCERVARGLLLIAGIVHFSAGGTP